MYGKILTLLGLVSVLTTVGFCSPIRDDLAAKGIEYIGQEQVVPIAYLKSTGEQYISIPYSANHRTHATIVAAFPDIFTQKSIGAIFGQYTAGNRFALRLWEEGSANGRFSYAWHNGWSNTPRTPYIDEDNDHFYSISLYSYLYNGSPRGRCVCDGYRLSDSYDTGEFLVDSDEFQIFRAYGITTYAPIRIRCASFSIFEEDEKIFDLLPVRIGSTGYMLDTVSGELFRNAGTGSFILGPDIASLEY